MVTTPNYDLDIDTTLGGNNASDYVVPSQKAIKAYVDNSTGGNVMWGNIAGNISNQTDLQDALDDKQDKLTIDSALSTTSTNPVQNKVITNALNLKANSADLSTVATSGSYNDLSNKPTIPDTSNLANKDLSNLSSTGNAKFQEPLVSGTNIKTINNNSILGSGNLTLDGLPSQTGQSGKFLTTNGTTASWGNATLVTFRDWSVA